MEILKADFLPQNFHFIVAKNGNLFQKNEHRDEKKKNWKNRSKMIDFSIREVFEK